MLGLFANAVAAGLLAFTIFFYAVVYSMWLKRATPQNIVIGGAAGALPPVIGWAVATGGVAAESLAMFALIFLWTPPHFWALALFRNDDYARAGVPMLPVTAGPRATRRHILAYARGAGRRGAGAGLQRDRRAVLSRRGAGAERDLPRRGLARSGGATRPSPRRTISAPSGGSSASRSSISTLHFTLLLVEAALARARARRRPAGRSSSEERAMRPDSHEILRTPAEPQPRPRADAGGLRAAHLRGDDRQAHRGRGDARVRPQPAHAARRRRTERWRARAPTAASASRSSRWCR